MVVGIRNLKKVYVYIHTYVLGTWTLWDIIRAHTLGYFFRLLRAAAQTALARARASAAESAAAAKPREEAA